ncbi:MAG: hypothetical protein AAGG11_01040 [Pseudomonadota bacterium]
MTNRRLVRVLLALLGSVLLLGCGSNSPRSVEPVKGTVVGSVSYVGLPAEYRIYYAPVGASVSERASIRVSSGGSDRRKGQIDAGNDLFSIELPEGQYEVVLWEVSEGRAQIRPEQPFAAPFTVVPGRSVYIGRFDFKHQQGIRSRESSVDVTYSDQLQQDVALFQDDRAMKDAPDLRLGINEGMRMQWSSDAGATDKAVSLIVFSSF